MSVVYSFTGNSLDADGWAAAFEEVADREDLLLMCRGVEKLETNDVFATPLGGIRGVSVNLGETADVRLSALANQTDWGYAYAIMRHVLETGGGSLADENGEVFTEDSLSDEDAQAKYEHHFPFDLKAMTSMSSAQGTGEVTVPLLMVANLCFNTADLPGGGEAPIEEIDAWLTRIVTRYGAAFTASTMTLNGGAKLASYALIPTLVSDVDGLAVHNLLGPGVIATIPMDDLMRILGDRAEVCGDGVTYLPGITADDEPELIDALRAAVIEPQEFMHRFGDGSVPKPDGTAGKELDALSKSFMDMPKEAQAILLRGVRDIVQAVYKAAGEGTPPNTIVAAIEEEFGEVLGDDIPPLVAAGVLTLIGDVATNNDEARMIDRPHVIELLTRELSMPRILCIGIAEAAREIYEHVQAQKAAREKARAKVKGTATPTSKAKAKAKRKRST